MITQLQLFNFQAHKKLTLDLGNITTIIGPTDAGKSAIIRALRWVCLNKPAGVEFLRHGAKHVGVAIEVDGQRIVRKRKGASNTYSKRHFDQKEPQSFTAFGRDVPDSIQRLLNISDDNFQNQHDPVFWFTMSPNQVSRELNRIVALEELDLALKLAADKARHTKTAYEVALERTQVAKATRRRLTWVKACSKEFIQLEDTHNQQNDAKIQLEELQSILKEIHHHEEKVFRAEDNLQTMERQLKKMPVEKLQTARNEWQQLSHLTSRIRKQESNLCRHQQNLKITKKTLRKEIGNTCPLCGNHVQTIQTKES